MIAFSGHVKSMMNLDNTPTAAIGVIPQIEISLGAISRRFWVPVENVLERKAADRN